MTNAINQNISVAGLWTGYRMEQGRRIGMDVEISVENGVLIAKGEDEVGNFDLEGTHRQQDGKIVLKTNDIYGANYTGLANENSIWGYWAKDNLFGEFRLKRLSESEYRMKVAFFENKDGPWIGYYMHLDLEYSMKMNLRFSNGQVNGSGIDDIGEFEIEGQYSLVSGNLAWLKKYIGKHQVTYSGKMEQHSISGQWQISYSEGSFKLWPYTAGGTAT